MATKSIRNESRRGVTEFLPGFNEKISIACVRNSKKKKKRKGSSEKTTTSKRKGDFFFLNQKIKWSSHRTGLKTGAIRTAPAAGVATPKQNSSSSSSSSGGDALIIFPARIESKSKSKSATLSFIEAPPFDSDVGADQSERPARTPSPIGAGRRKKKENNKNWRSVTQKKKRKSKLGR